MKTYVAGLILLLFSQLILLARTQNTSEGEHRLLQNSVTWDEAVSACRELGPDYSVPVILEQSDLPTLQQAMTSSGVTEAWLALRRDRFQTWMWLNGYPIDKDFTKQNWKDYMHCGNYHTRDSVLEVDNCTINRYGYICEGNNTCSLYPVNPVDCLTVHGRVYIYGCYAASWYDARHKCRKLGMDLAVMTSREDQKLISDQWHAKDKKHCTQLWVGLRRVDWLQNHQPIPGSISQPWAPGQPHHEGECAVATIGGATALLWKTANCAHMKRVVCFRNTVLPGTGTTSSMTINITLLMPPRGTAPSDGNKQIWWIVIGIAIGMVIFVIIIIAFVWISKYKRKTPLQTYSVHDTQNHDRPVWRTSSRFSHGDILGDVTADREPLMLPDIRREYAELPTGVVCVLCAELHKLTSGRSSHYEVTLRIYAVLSYEGIDVTDEIQALVRDQTGVTLRKDMYLKLPTTENDQADWSLVTELSLEDTALHIKGDKQQESDLRVLMSRAGGSSGRQAAEFVVTEIRNRKLQTFRIHLKYIWKRSGTLMKPVEYTEVVDCPRIKEESKMRASCDQLCRGPSYSKNMWRGSRYSFGSTLRNQRESQLNQSIGLYQDDDRCKKENPAYLPSPTTEECLTDQNREPIIDLSAPAERESGYVSATDPRVASASTSHNQESHASVETVAELAGSSSKTPLAELPYAPVEQAIATDSGHATTTSCDRTSRDTTHGSPDPATQSRDSDLPKSKHDSDFYKTYSRDEPASSDQYASLEDSQINSVQDEGKEEQSTIKTDDIETPQSDEEKTLPAAQPASSEQQVSPGDVDLNSMEDKRKEEQSVINPDDEEPQQSDEEKTLPAAQPVLADQHTASQELDEHSMQEKNKEEEPVTKSEDDQLRQSDDEEIRPPAQDSQGGRGLILTAVGAVLDQVISAK